MAEYVRGKLGSSRLPSEANGAAEFSVPHPTRVAGQTRHGGSVGEVYRCAASFPIDECRKEASRIPGDPGERLPGRFGAKVVGRPALFESVDVAGKIFRV